MHILQLWFCDYIPFNQHGFQPGKGTGTAWSDLLTKVLPSANIYEFDLSKFFDSVNLDYLLRLLIACLFSFSPVFVLIIKTLLRIKVAGGVPASLANQIVDWNRTLAESPLRGGELGAHQNCNFNSTFLKVIKKMY